MQHQNSSDKHQIPADNVKLERAYEPLADGRMLSEPNRPPGPCEILTGYIHDYKQIAYEHIAELGGLRARAQGIAPDVNAFWENQSFHNYADYAMGSSFRSGFAKLRELGAVRRCAVMYTEAVWWRCHRQIIADYLLVAGERVFHILGLKAVAPASLTKGATP